MPILLLGFLFVGGLLWWNRAHRFPEMPIQAGIPTLLNFTPYVLQPGKDTFTYGLAPEGLNAQQIINAFAGSAVETPVIVRAHIPIPGPSTLPAFANLWEVHTRLKNTTTITVSPSSELQEYGVPEAASNVNAPQQLAGLLYATALNPTTIGRELFISIAAKQA